MRSRVQWTPRHSKVLVMVIPGIVSIRLTPELKRIGNSEVECFPEEEMVAGSNPARSTATVRTIRSQEVHLGR